MKALFLKDLKNIFLKSMRNLKKILKKNYPLKNFAD